MVRSRLDPSVNYTELNRLTPQIPKKRITGPPYMKQ